MNASRLAIALLAACLLAAPVAAAAGGVVEATLDNGLRVLVLEDRRSPVVSVQVWYRVGSRNERPGATGLAHFLEHMMFKGTPAHGRGQYARLVEQNGGQDNAFTTQDVTAYYVDIAADRLPLVLGLEADRMRHLLLDPVEVNAERQVVMEERRSRTEDDPDGILSEEVSALAFRAHPYGAPVIGWMEDLRRITPAELRRFYDTYYRPNNALLVVAGDATSAEVLDQVRAHFESLPRGPEPPPVTVDEPAQLGERRVTVRKPGAELALVALAWHVPTASSPDAPALELLSVVLSGGRSSRLHRRLVQERSIALGAGTDYSYHSRDPNLFWVYATALPGQAPEAVERALLEELERIKTEPVGDEELERAKNQVEAAFVWRQDSVHARASMLARFELLGSWRLADRLVPLIRGVTATDLERVARTYFRADRRTVGVLLPGEAPPAGDR